MQHYTMHYKTIHTITITYNATQDYKIQRKKLYDKIIQYEPNNIQFNTRPYNTRQDKTKQDKTGKYNTKKKQYNTR